MENQTQLIEKKAYHTPQLRSFGTVKEGTEAITHGGEPDGNTSFGMVYYTFSFQ